MNELSVERWWEYEREKEKLRQLALSPEEYEAALRELARRYGL